MAQIQYIITQKEMGKIKQLIDDIQNLRLCILPSSGMKISKETRKFIAGYLWNLMETLKEIKDI